MDDDLKTGALERQVIRLAPDSLSGHPDLAMDLMATKHLDEARQALIKPVPANTINAVLFGVE